MSFAWTSWVNFIAQSLKSLKESVQIDENAGLLVKWPLRAEPLNSRDKRLGTGWQAEKRAEGDQLFGCTAPIIRVYFKTLTISLIRCTLSVIYMVYTE